MSWGDIIGHERPVAILKRALENGMLAHAYLFSGDEGIGKKMTAVALAAAVNCHAPGPDGSCGQCPSCRKIAGQGHPDVHMLAPDNEEIKIDQIRAVQADLALKPFEGTKKVLIVDGADTMNTPAANAFLKTLEEPPGDSLVILVSARPRSLLPTIRSRCQEVRFQPLPRNVLAGVLMRVRGMTEDEAAFVAALSQGSLGQALAMDAAEEQAAREAVLELWSRARGLGDDELLSEAEALAKDRERLDRMLAIGTEWLRDAVVYRATGNEGLLVNCRRTALLREWTGRFSLSRMLADRERFVASRTLLDRRVSALLVAENLLLGLRRE